MLLFSDVQMSFLFSGGYKIEPCLQKTWYYKASLLQRIIHISTFLYLPGNEFLTEPSDVPLSLQILLNLKRSNCIRVFTESPVYKLPYFKISYMLKAMLKTSWWLLPTWSYLSAVEI